MSEQKRMGLDDGPLLPMKRRGIDGPLLPREQLSLEREARDKGMELAAAKNAEYLGQARAVAVWLTRRGTTSVSINDVREWISTKLPGLDIVWGAWTGSVFKGKQWERVGYTQARHKGSHARVVGVWRLREGK